MTALKELLEEEGERIEWDQSDEETGRGPRK
jgi:hypothetical protein